MSWFASRLADLLPQVPAALREQVATRTRALELAKGQLLLSAGAPWQHLWHVERGALRLYYLDREGAESNKNFVFDGQLLWPITRRLRGEPVNFFIAALEPSRVHALAMDDIDALLAGEAGWTALRLDALQQLLDEKLWREHLFLQCDATERYSALRAARPTWCERIPLRHQASWLTGPSRAMNGRRQTTCARP